MLALGRVHHWSARKCDLGTPDMLKMGYRLSMRLKTFLSRFSSRLGVLGCGERERDGRRESE